jgi:hypothetical protein
LSPARRAPTVFRASLLNHEERESAGVGQVSTGDCTTSSTRLRAHLMRRMKPSKCERRSRTIRGIGPPIATTALDARRRSRSTLWWRPPLHKGQSSAKRLAYAPTRSRAVQPVRSARLRQIVALLRCGSNPFPASAYPSVTFFGSKVRRLFGPPSFRSPRQRKKVHGLDPHAECSLNITGQSYPDAAWLREAHRAAATSAAHRATLRFS